MTLSKKIQHAQMLCISSNDYGDRTLNINEGQVDDEDEVF
jgi:hypothetical protein